MCYQTDLLFLITSLKPCIFFSRLLSWTQRCFALLLKGSQQEKLRVEQLVFTTDYMAMCVQLLSYLQTSPDHFLGFYQNCMS